jgi:hypothetical protein
MIKSIPIILFAPLLIIIISLLMCIEITPYKIVKLNHIQIPRWNVKTWWIMKVVIQNQTNYTCFTKIIPPTIMEHTYLRNLSITLLWLEKQQI